MPAHGQAWLRHGRSLVRHKDAVNGLASMPVPWLYKAVRILTDDPSSNRSRSKLARQLKEYSEDAAMSSHRPRAGMTGGGGGHDTGAR